ncbi:MAG: bifunctional diguanylate cyclase/phosphodiesterase [Rhodospirillales bacterium]
MDTSQPPTHSEPPSFFRVVGLPVGLVLVCITVLFGSFIWPSEISNRIQIAAQQNLLTNLLRKQVSVIADQVTSCAIWEQAYFQIAAQRDVDWTVENFGKFYWEHFGTDEVHILFADGEHFASMVHGEAAEAAAFTRVQPQVADLIKAVIDRAPVVADHPSDVIKELSYHSGQSATFRLAARIIMLPEGPAIAIAANIIPDYTERRMVDAPPPLMVTLYALSAERFSELGHQFDFPELRWIATPDLDHSDASLALTDEAGAPIGELTWQPVLASHTFFRDGWLPGLMVMLLVATVAFLVSRSNSKLLQRIAISEADARTKALHDPLTGLPNRRRFLEVTETDFPAALAAGRPVALLTIDLDRFKELNDTLGHIAGDYALVEIAGRIAGAAARAHMVSRVGGDEFMILLIGADSCAGAEHIAEQIIAAVREPLALYSGIVGELGASIGIARAPEHATDAVELARRADIALYYSKSLGRNRVTGFRPEMEDRLLWGHKIETALRTAIAEESFSLVYQPQVAPDGFTITGAEALLRWVHPTLGPISPSQFIPVAEERRLMWELGAFVLDRAIADACDWGRLRVAINVSAQQFARGDLVNLVARTLDLHQFPPARLELEITESALIHDEQQASEQIQRLKALGVSIALDDFGMGYSSLRYLRRFEFDRLKIDRVFIKDLSPCTNIKTIVDSIIKMSHALGLVVVAEGIETYDQYMLLRLAGCDQLQGFLFSQPLPQADLLTLLREAGSCLPRLQDRAS